MFVLLLRLILIPRFISLFLYSMFSPLSRFRALKLLVTRNIYSLVSSPIITYFLFILFLFFCLINLLGNFPLFMLPTNFYSVTLTTSLLFWLPIVICVSFTQLKSFLAHLLPYGAPAALSLFLPLVEGFSFLIRPFTLMIRLRTNLSAGHIIMYMFSYFTLLSSFLSPFIYIVLSLLFVLELCISLLQAYIFMTLLRLYIVETC